jgi:hypothetical protein
MQDLRQKVEFVAELLLRISEDEAKDDHENNKANA